MGDAAVDDSAVHNIAVDDIAACDLVFYDSVFYDLVFYDLIFYEKPGCSNNRRQKALLQAAGLRLDVRDLLNTPWTAASLRVFFGELPVAQWFNRSAPAITRGALDPQSLSADAALAAMLADPLLIRRPLITWAGGCVAGFDAEALARACGRPLSTPPADIETCRNVSTPCPPARAGAE